MYHRQSKAIHTRMENLTAYHRYIKLMHQILVSLLIIFSRGWGKGMHIHLFLTVKDYLVNMSHIVDVT
ncbi:hypothetical protein C1N62_12495 [Nissabacter sp. SGAir0207]|nr:hypothetical protein C1N62_12495 [Nissabacter sp. SGAir0207]